MTTEAEARINEAEEKIQNYEGIEIPEVCPECGSKFKLMEEGGLVEFVCVDLNCNYKFNPKKEAWKKHVKKLFDEEKEFRENPQLMRTIFNDLSRRVKHDNVTKSAVLVSGISAYLPEPLNLFEKGQSGSGKTYNAIETLAYFPQDDIWYLSGMSPKALVHQKGVLLDKDGVEIDFNDKPVKPKKSFYKGRAEEYQEANRDYQEQTVLFNERLKDSYNYINIENKIFVFLETPNGETLRMLYPILSHDKRKVEYRFVNKSGSGSLRTDKVVVDGYPSAIFLTTDREHVEELATRSFTVSPEACEEKIESANKLTNLKASLPWKANKETATFTQTKALIEKIKKFVSEQKLDVILPFLDLSEIFPKKASRDMRDFCHFTQFVKAWTILHIYQRPLIECYEKKFVLSNSYDVVCCFQIFKELIETTRTGTEKRILEFYRNYMLTGQEGYYVSELTTSYNEKEKNKLSDFTIRKWLERLNEIGYVQKVDDTEDKRRKFYKPILKKAELVESVCKTEKTVDLLPKIENGFKSWKKIICEEDGIKELKKFSDDSIISLDELDSLILVDEKNVLTYSANVFNNLNNPDLIPDSENKPENIDKKAKQTNSSNSKNLEEIRNWIVENKKDNMILKSVLNEKILEFGLEPDDITSKFVFESFLFDVPILGAWRVAK